MRLFSKLALTSASVLAFASVAVAADVDLGLTVSGNIYGAPEWQNGAGSKITTLDFAFSGVAQPAGNDVNSPSYTVKIVDPQKSGLPVSIALTKPSGCDIGGTAISNESHVIFIHGGTEEAADTSFNLVEGANTALQLQFDGAANVGAATGAVACSAGVLTYSYTP